jgi:hypothetical protein
LFFGEAFFFETFDDFERVKVVVFGEGGGLRKRALVG